MVGRLLFLLVCLSAAPVRAELMADIAAALPGSYENLAQWEAAGRPKAADRTGHVRMNAVVVPAALPWFDGQAFYIQQIQDDFAPHVYRQAVLLFARGPNGTVTMTQRDLRDGDAWIDAHLDPARLSRLTEADLRPADSGCALLWTRSEAGLIAETAPGACVIRSARLSVDLKRTERWTLDGGVFTHFDRVVGPDGAVLHESPQGRPFRLERQGPLPRGAVTR